MRASAGRLVLSGNGARLAQERKPFRNRKSPKLQDTVRLSANGVAKVLGDLETRIMRVLWDLQCAAPAKLVHAEVAKTHPISPLTVITVLNRMAEKGILRRSKKSELLHYETRMTESEFMTLASRHVVEGVFGFEPDAVATSFVDVWAERDPDRLDSLRRLIDKRIRERDKAADCQRDKR